MFQEQLKLQQAIVLNNEKLTDLRLIKNKQLKEQNFLNILFEKPVGVDVLQKTLEEQELTEEHLIFLIQNLENKLSGILVNLTLYKLKTLEDLSSLEEELLQKRSLCDSGEFRILEELIKFQQLFFVEEK